MASITGRMSWLSAFRTALFGMAGALLFSLIATLIAGSTSDAFVIVFIAVFVAAGIWAGRARGGINFGLVMLIIWTALGVVFGAFKAFTHPSSWIDFTTMTGMTMFTVLGVIAYVRGRARGWSEPADPLLTRAVGLLIIAALAGGLASAAADESDEKITGDLEVRAVDLVFEPAQLSATAGEVGVFVTNEDATHHDFTIDGVGRLEVPALKQKRAFFTLEPGTYEFVCTLHIDMEGTLTVT